MFRSLPADSTFPLLFMPSGSLPPQTPRRIAFTVFALLYVFGLAAYFVYGHSTDTGLSGWLTNWQLQTFSEAHTSLTRAALIVIWVVCMVPLFYLLMRLNKAENYVPAQHHAKFNEAAYSLRGRALLALGFVGVSAAIFAYLTMAQNRLASQPLYQLDLNNTATPPARAELASIHGTVAANYTYALEEVKYGRKEGSTYYVPLLPATWQPDQPVRVVLKTRIPVYQDLTLNRVYFLDSTRAFSATYDGRLHANDVPTIVRQHLASQQITLANPCYVLDDEEVINGQAGQAGASSRWMVLGMGLVMAIGILVRRPPNP